jgi:hypothetical protein
VIRKIAAPETDAAKVGRKRLKSGVTGETSHEHNANMAHRLHLGKRKVSKKQVTAIVFTIVLYLIFHQILYVLKNSS